MFEVLEVKDLVQIVPESMTAFANQDDFASAVEHAITTKYLLKIIPGTAALVVAVVDILEMGYARMAAGGPSAWVGATFTLAVFRPRAKQRIRARISRQDANGICLTIDFFNNIFVPAHLLCDPSEYDAAKGAWRYVPNGDRSAFAPYETGADVIVAVHAVNEQTPVVGGASSGSATSGAQPGGSAATLPLIVHGSFADPGLGPCKWYEDGGAEEEEVDPAATTTTAGEDPLMLLDADSVADAPS